MKEYTSGNIRVHHRDRKSLGRGAKTNEVREAGVGESALPVEVRRSRVSAGSNPAAVECEWTERPPVSECGWSGSHDGDDDPAREWRIPPCNALVDRPGYEAAVD